MSGSRIKDILRRWAKPVVSPTSDVDKRANDWWMGIQGYCRDTYGSIWNPFEKAMWLMGFDDGSRETQTKVYELTFGRDLAYDNYVSFFLLEQWLPEEKFPPGENTHAIKFYLTLLKVQDHLEWRRLKESLFAHARIDLIDHYLTSQLGINMTDVALERKALLLWYMVGKPKRPDFYYLNLPNKQHGLYTNYYSNEIAKLFQMIREWGNVPTPIHYTLVTEEQPMDASNVATFQPINDTKMITFRLIEIITGNIKSTEWYVCTERGDYPVKMGGEPEDMAIIVQPFYRFEPGPTHGMTTCMVRVASGIPCQGWYIRVAKDFRIVSVQDHNQEHVSSFTIPANSPALALFKIDCPLKCVLP